MAGGWEDWRWDESLFGGAAAYYDRGRLPNAPGLADQLAAALDLDGSGRLLDVGCGPGTVTLPFAPLFVEALGIDADPDMVEEAARLARAREVANARFLHLRAEELPAGLGTFRAITFAASFHWMDRTLVARTAHGMLDPEGVVVHVDNRHQEPPSPVMPVSLPAPTVPRNEIDALRRRYLGPHRRAGASVRNSSPSDEASVFRSAGFEGPETVPVPDGRHLVRTIDDVVAEVFSTSSTAPHLFGRDLDAFEADLRDVLATAAGRDGTLGVTLPDNELKIWRPRRT